jgi:segregation and condensation protein B
VDAALAALKEKYAAAEHGIELLMLGGGYMFVPKKELWEHLKGRYGKKNDSRLSRAALETLSIIAYSQPITRLEIENLRGVKSADTMMSLLLSRDLIREVGKKDAPGKPQQYGTTKEFLKLFRLSSIADLPKLEEEDRERFALNG